MENRRSFLLKTLKAGGLLVAGHFPFGSFAHQPTQRLTILHTNDMHSRLDPFPMDGSPYQGQGGVAARATLIEQIRQQEEHVLLFDAGDIFQGTPYFNLYKGEPEIKAMSMMGYDAITMGNHDFDAGIDGFVQQLEHASFAVLTANYNFTHTALEHKTQPYKIFRKGNIKIGVFGLGIKLAGLVPHELYGKTEYLDPVVTGNRISEHLKKNKGCDMVICISHLGFNYNGNKVSDCILARESDHIDLIIGGHTHTFLNNPVVVKNKSGKDVIINQAGWAGLRLGKLTFTFDSKKNTKLTKATTVIPGKQTIG